MDNFYTQSKLEEIEDRLTKLENKQRKFLGKHTGVYRFEGSYAEPLVEMYSYGIREFSIEEPNTFNLNRGFYKIINKSEIRIGSFGDPHTYHKVILKRNNGGC